MKTICALALAASVAALTACSGGGAYYASAGGPDAYYDDFYGPYYDGYWGVDGGFYYRGGRHAAFQRDDGTHFHRDAAQGFHRVPSTRAPANAMRAPMTAPANHGPGAGPENRL